MSPIALTDDELTAVMAAARPLDRDQRDAFLQAVAAELRKPGGAVGPGTVYRVCAELQRKFANRGWRLTRTSFITGGL